MRGAPRTALAPSIRHKSTARGSTSWTSAPARPSRSVGRTGLSSLRRRSTYSTRRTCRRSTAAAASRIRFRQSSDRFKRRVPALKGSWPRKSAGKEDVMRVADSVRYAAATIAVLIASAGGRAAVAAEGLRESDLSTLQSVGEVRVSRNGGRVVYAVVRNDRPGRPYTQLWVQEVGASSGKLLLPP